MSAGSTVTDRVVATPSGSSWMPRRDPEKTAVRAQLERVLANPSFKNSKRYPALLRFVVERVLDGHTDSLKERTLGIEVFHRDPNYDTNQDPVVRTTAVEVRKRLTQYYQEPGHENEIRIEFPSGSYMPEFRLPVAAEPDPEVAAPRASRRPVVVPRWVFAVVGVVVVAGALAWWSPWAAPSALDRFWSPVWNSSDHVLICVGGLADGVPASAGASGLIGSPASLFSSPEDFFGRDEGVPLAEVGAVARIVGQRMARGKTFHVRFHSMTKFVDLRDGPAVLIGGFDNSWTVRLLDELHLRFHLEREGAVAWIGDRQNPSQRAWLVDTRSNGARDYAVISRVWNQGTGKEMVSVAGLSSFGTAAAGEFLSEPRYLDAAVATAREVLAEQERADRDRHPAHGCEFRSSRSPGHSYLAVKARAAFFGNWPVWAGSRCAPPQSSAPQSASPRNLCPL